jgi:hypothetical protein
MPRRVFSSHYSLIIIGLILTVCAANINWGGDRWKDIVASDGKGYYAYLPAIVIYKDLSFAFHGNIENRYYSRNTFSDYRVIVDGKQVNKYTAGTALLQLPFFLAAHLIALTSDYPADGYSFPYQMTINLAGIFYLLLGLYFLGRWLSDEGAARWSITIVQIGLAFATPLFYYSVCEPAMSHVYSFAAISAICFFSRRFFTMPGKADWLLLCALLGLSVVIRPVNGLIVLALPFLAGTPKQLMISRDRLTVQRGKFLAGLLAGIAVFSILPVLYRLQTGHWWMYTYGQEHINLSNPHLIDFLFSYRKGFFVYTPFAFICLSGFIFWRAEGWRPVFLLVFLVAVVYVLSSWSVWWYGGSFSQRAMIEYLPFFAFLLTKSTDGSGRAVGRLMASATVVTVLLCQLQTYQYRYYLIHWEKMDKEHYWRVFLKTNGIGESGNPNKDLLE